MHKHCKGTSETGYSIVKLNLPAASSLINCSITVITHVGSANKYVRYLCVICRYRRGIERNLNCMALKFQISNSSMLT